MELRILGAHSLETPTTKHTCFLLDEVLALDAGSLVTALTPQELHDIQAVLLTHRHFDHVRDLPTMGLMTRDANRTVPLYSLAETLEAVSTRLMDGVLYPRLAESLDGRAAKYRLEAVEDGVVLAVLDYLVKPISVPHGPPTIGYIIHRPGEGAFAYTGDTGGRLMPFFQDAFKPDPVCVEVTFASRLDQRAYNAGHLTPRRLQQELTEALEQGTVLPRIVVVHMSPTQEDEIRHELAQVASSLQVDIVVAAENMRISI